MEQQVLIIEPSADYYLQLQQTMNATSPDIHFCQASDAGDALHLMQEYSPSICLIDDIAGRENDSALLNTLHHDHPGTIVILLTEGNDLSGCTYNDEKTIHFRFNKTNDFGSICDTVIKML